MRWLLMLTLLGCGDKDTGNPDIIPSEEQYCMSLEDVGTINTFDSGDSQCCGDIEVQLIVDKPNIRDPASIANQGFTIVNPTIGAGEQYSTSNEIGLIERNLGAGEWELYVENDFDCTAELTIQVEAGVRTQHCLLLECPE